LTESFDIAVVGAGPAGSVLALRLAQLGKHVALIEKTAEFGPRPGEALTPGLLPLLATAGLRARFEAARCLKFRSAQILWAGRSRRADESGFIVDRARLDSLLLAAAVEAGVCLIRPARITERAFERAWSLRLDNGRTLTARYLADAAGRARMLDGRKVANGASTFALCGYWSDVDASCRDTFVEATLCAWYWGAPLDDGIFSAMAFVDAPKARLQRYAGLIEASRLLAPRLQRARCLHLGVCDATPFIDLAPVDETSIKVGDAALCIDPLSAQGVQTAVGTALHGAAVINTILDRPDDRSLAIEFYGRRVRQSASFHSTAAAAFYREQFAACATDFWRKRAEPWASAPIPGRAAFSWAKVRVASRARFVRHGVSDGCHIIPEDAVELDGTAGAYIDGIRLRDLLGPASAPVDPDELISRWVTFMPVERARRMFQWACTEGWIESA
jgi:flavin-dependent dehydrogenase